MHRPTSIAGAQVEWFAAFDTPDLHRDIDHPMKVTDVARPVLAELNKGLIAASGACAASRGW